jgi:methylglutamate dehydrogenase subunit D
MQKEHGCVSELSNSVTAENHPAILERSDVAITHVSARRRSGAALAEAARARFGKDLPSTPHVVDAGGTMIVWAGPEQWLIIEPRTEGVDASAKLATAFAGLASTVDVSDSRTIFRVGQTRPSEALARSMRIDFEDRAFKPGDAAITQVSHLGIMVWRLPDGSGYEFACARTYSRDFLGWLNKV